MNLRKRLNSFNNSWKSVKMEGHNKVLFVIQDKYLVSCPNETHKCTYKICKNNYNFQLKNQIIEKTFEDTYIVLTLIHVQLNSKLIVAVMFNKMIRLIH